MSVQTAAEPKTRLTVMIFTDIIESTRLRAHLGDNDYKTLLDRHNSLFIDGLREIGGARCLSFLGDGFLAEFRTPSDAVRFALKFQAQMKNADWGVHRLEARLGIHQGEVTETVQLGQCNLTGAAVDTASRIMSIARGGQVLMTHAVFNDARQNLRRAAGDASAAPLEWLSHGPYHFKGVDEAMTVFEVGEPGINPLTRPPDGEKGWRVVAPDHVAAETGWRPAVSLEIPGRPGWFIKKKIGDGGFGEVWLGEQEKLDELRIFKFCFDTDRLRSFKREVTLVRLLKKSLGERRDIAQLRELKLDEPPFFIESDYVGGGSLLDYAEKRGGVATLPLETRLRIVAQIADAVAAAHSVGVLHKDIKPSNILIDELDDGTIQPMLADFGIGVLTDLSRLNAVTLTPTNTNLTLGNESSRTGTRLYSPPEDQATIQGDIYALGVLLYQMIIGDLNAPMAGGWERRIDDPLLLEDLAEMTDGDPARRPASAKIVAERLRTLPQRREALRKANEFQRRAQRRRSQVRIAAVLAGVFLVLSVLLSIAFYRERKLRLELAEQRREAEQQRHQAEIKKQDAEATLAFLNDDVLLRATPAQLPNPLVRNELINALIVPATQTVGESFKDRPTLEAQIRQSLATILHAAGREDLAVDQYRRVMDIRSGVQGKDDLQTISAVEEYAQSLYHLGRLPEAVTLFKQAVDDRTRLCGLENRDTLETIRSYALLVDQSGNPTQARTLYENALAASRKTFGTDDSLTYRILNNYAGCLVDLKDLAGAKPLFRQALEFQIKSSGPSSRDTLLAMNNYAQILARLGEPQHSEPLCRRVLLERHQLLGHQHPDTIAALISYATMLEYLGRDKQAEQMASAALESAESNPSLGSDHFLTASIAKEESLILSAMHRDDDAAALREKYHLRAPQTSVATQRVTLPDPQEDEINMFVQFVRVNWSYDPAWNYLPAFPPLAQTLADLEHGDDPSAAAPAAARTASTTQVAG